MLILVTVAALFFGRQANWIQHRRQFVGEHRNAREQTGTEAFWIIKFTCEQRGEESWLDRWTRKLFGEPEHNRPQQVIFVAGEAAAAKLASDNRLAIERTKSLFPEADRVNVEFAYPKAVEPSSAALVQQAASP
jgi:hypothetical protein